LRIQIGESPRQLFAISRVLARVQILLDPRARQEQDLFPAVRFHLLGRKLLPVSILVGFFSSLDLIFYGFAFPSLGHGLFYGAKGFLAPIFLKRFAPQATLADGPKTPQALG
jgi:hypothetical protein